MNAEKPVNPDLAVKEQLRLMVRRRDRRNRIHLACFLICISAGLVWMCFIDMRKPGNTFLASVIAAPLLGMLVDFVWKLPRARCPRCGCGWEVADSPNEKDWDGRICPGCGLKAGDDE